MAEPLKPLRRNVCAVLTDGAGERVLVFRRIEWGRETHPWQFPQGGLEQDETPEQGLMRELLEEVGTNTVEVLRRAPVPIVYEWPADVMASLATDRSKLAKYRGQEQHWFLARLHHGAADVNFRHQPAEFDAWEWVTPQQALERVVSFKRQAYEAGLTALGLLGSAAGSAVPASASRPER
ncbi:MAG TPA: RNA pyrophosphohydrolase [bacterium]